jgi:hypothetical protein
VQRVALADRLQGTIAVNTRTEADIAADRAEPAPAAATTIAGDDDEEDEKFEDETGDALNSLAIFGLGGVKGAASPAAGVSKAACKAAAKAKGAASKTAITAANKSMPAPSVPMPRGAAAVAEPPLSSPSKGAAGRKSKAETWAFDPQAYLDNDGMDLLHAEVQQLQAALDVDRFVISAFSLGRSRKTDSQCGAHIKYSGGSIFVGTLCAGVVLCKGIRVACVFVWVKRCGYMYGCVMHLHKHICTCKLYDIICIIVLSTCVHVSALERGSPLECKCRQPLSPLCRHLVCMYRFIHACTCECVCSSLSVCVGLLVCVGFLMSSHACVCVRVQTCVRACVQVCELGMCVCQICSNACFLSRSALTSRLRLSRGFFLTSAPSNINGFRSLAFQDSLKDLTSSDEASKNFQVTPKAKFSCISYTRE